MIATTLAVLAIFGGSKLEVALLVLGIPVADAFFVLLRRVVNRRSPFAPDRTHFHHRLLDRQFVFENSRGDQGLGR